MTNAISGNARRLAITVRPSRSLRRLMLAPLRSNNQRLLGCAWTTNRTPVGFLKLCVPLKAVNAAKELAMAKSIF